MARITLLRHAKAETPTADMADFDRVLSARGRRNADRMGRFVAESGLLPDLVILSPSARTRQTFELASAHWPDVKTECRDGIYEASAETILTAVTTLGDSYEHVMVIGHNPGLVVLLHHLVESVPPAVNMAYFPTSCLAEIGFDVPTVGAINPEEGRLLSFVRVRELAET
ncbi:MAG: SixA phosphatase family protein [Candidatus Puniceispirillaceae bacterium]